MRHWRRPPIQRLILTVGAGTALTPWWRPTRMLPPNWNGRRDERRHAAAPPRQRRSSSEPRRSLQTRHRRADRALAAAHAKVEAGAVQEASDLLAMAEAGPLGEHERARVAVVHAMLGFTTRSIGEATAGLFEAAKRLALVDVALARRTFLDTMGMALNADRVASPDADATSVARAAATLAGPEPRRQADLLFDGFVALFDRGYAAGVPILREALTADVGHMSAFEQLQWVHMAATAASYLWDHDGWMELSDRCPLARPRCGRILPAPCRPRRAGTSAGLCRRARRRDRPGGRGAGGE